MGVFQILERKERVSASVDCKRKWLSLEWRESGRKTANFAENTSPRGVFVDEVHQIMVDSVSEEE